jgi:hypothetical protein
VSGDEKNGHRMEIVSAVYLFVLYCVVSVCVCVPPPRKQVELDGIEFDSGTRGDSADSDSGDSGDSGDSDDIGDSGDSGVKRTQKT